MNVASGELDRRITVQIAIESRDAANDVIRTWVDAFSRWARKADRGGRETQGADQLIRDADTIFTIRSDIQSREIAPETHRVVYKGSIYTIIGIQEPLGTRGDALMLLCSSRPDHAGARGKDVNRAGP